jgi:hypothetical protein
MNNFIHSKCKSIIYCEVGSMFQILVENLVIGQRRVKPAGQANIRELNNQGKISFFCPECNKEVPASEVVIPCSHCGTLLPLNEALKVTDIAGAFCKKHVSLVTEGTSFTIESALKNYLKEIK